MVMCFKSVPKVSFVDFNLNFSGFVSIFAYRAAGLRRPSLGHSTGVKSWKLHECGWHFCHYGSVLVVFGQMVG